MIIASSKKRLLQYLNYKKVTLTSFYKKTGIKRGFLDTDKLNATISDVFIAKIIAVFEDLNIIWLISGDGDMTSESSGSILQEPRVSYGKIDKDCLICKEKERVIQQQQALIDQQQKIINLLENKNK